MISTRCPLEDEARFGPLGFYGPYWSAAQRYPLGAKDPRLIVNDLRNANDSGIALPPRDNYPGQMYNELRINVEMAWN